VLKNWNRKCFWTSVVYILHKVRIICARKLRIIDAKTIFGVYGTREITFMRSGWFPLTLKDVTDEWFKTSNQQRQNPLRPPQHKNSGDREDNNWGEEKKEREDQWRTEAQSLKLMKQQQRHKPVPEGAQTFLTEIPSCWYFETLDLSPWS